MYQKHSSSLHFVEATLAKQKRCESWQNGILCFTKDIPVACLYISVGYLYINNYQLPKLTITFASDTKQPLLPP